MYLYVFNFKEPVPVDCVSDWKWNTINIKVTTAPSVSFILGQPASPEVELGI